MNRFNCQIVFCFTVFTELFIFKFHLYEQFSNLGKGIKLSTWIMPVPYCKSSIISARLLCCTDSVTPQMILCLVRISYFKNLDSGYRL